MWRSRSGVGSMAFSLRIRRTLERETVNSSLASFADDARVAPAVVLTGHSDDERANLVIHSGSAWAAVGAAAVLACNEFTVPSENRVGRDDGAEFAEDASAESLAFGAESAALVVGESEAAVAVEFEEDACLLFEEVDLGALVLVEPSGDGEDEHLEWCAQHSRRLWGARTPRYRRSVAHLSSTHHSTLA